jgi:hypothetical protein
MVVNDLDEVRYDLEIDGELVRRELARRVWERAGWATVAIAFAEKDKAGAWKPAKLALLRFRHIHEVWKKESAITLAGDDALALVDTIAGWRDTLAAGA